jgi:hypothetical protein
VIPSHRSVWFARNASEVTHFSKSVKKRGEPSLAVGDASVKDASGVKGS